MEWTRGVPSKTEEKIKCMDFLKAKWTILLFRKVITKITIFFSTDLQFLLQIEITILIFSMPTCPKASWHKWTFIKEYARQWWRWRTRQCCWLLIIIILKELSAPSVTNALSVSLKFYLRMVCCSCCIRTCNIFTVSNLNIYMFECLTRKLFIRLFIATFMINEGS